MNLLRVIVFGILAIIAVNIVASIVWKTLGFLFGLVVPVAVLAVVGFVLYNISGGKSLSGGRRKFLP